MDDSPLNSADFIDQFRAGDHEARVALYEHGIKVCIPYFCRKGFSYDEAQDLWFEIQLDLIKRNCPSYDPSRGPFGGWLRGVIKRVALNELKQRKRHPHVPLEEWKDLTSPDNHSEKEESGKSEVTIQLERAKELLSEPDRLLISERFDEGLSIDLIAERLEISKSAVRKRLSRALQELRQILERLLSGELRRRRKAIRRRNPRRAPAPESG